jgi:hypothetical protein
MMRLDWLDWLYRHHPQEQLLAMSLALLQAWP